MIQDTSIDAYKATNVEREAMCTALVDLHGQFDGLTDNEAARMLGWDPSDVSARRGDLGSVIYNRDKEMRRDPITRKLNKVWRLYDDKQQLKEKEPEPMKVIVV